LKLADVTNDCNTLKPAFTLSPATEGSDRLRVGAVTIERCALWCSHIERLRVTPMLQKRPPVGAVGRCPAGFPLIPGDGVLDDRLGF
jgi:hypothetical protein